MAGATGKGTTGSADEGLAGVSTSCAATCTGSMPGRRKSTGVLSSRLTLRNFAEGRLNTLAEFGVDALVGIANLP